MKTKPTTLPKHHTSVPRTIRLTPSDVEKLEAIRAKLSAELNVSLSANDVYVYLIRSAEV